MNEEIEEPEEVPTEKYEHSPLARPRTKGVFKWNNNPLDDRFIDYA